MEENENKTVEVTEEAVNQPSREEILAMSREENKAGDEREAQNAKKAMQIAYAVGIIIIGIIQLVHVFRGDKLPSELYIVCMGMMSTMGFYSGVKMSKQRGLYLAEGIVCGIACILFTVYWILGLCGVVV